MFKKSLLLLMCLMLVATFCFAGTVYVVVDEAPAAGGTWSNGIYPARGPDPRSRDQSGQGFLAISVYGYSWTGTVTLQKLCHNISGTMTWCDVRTYTSNCQRGLIDYQKDMIYRIGIKYGEYTSGTVRCELTNAGGW